MSVREVDAVGFGMEVAPARESRGLVRRLRLKSRLHDPKAVSEAPTADHGSSAEPLAKADALFASTAAPFQLLAVETEARRLFERATSLVDRSQYHLAVSLLRRVVRDLPDSAQGWYLLGFALGELGRRKESIECFDRVIELNPDLGQAFANRGWQRLRRRDVKGAVSDLRQATDLDPHDAMAWSHLGLALIRSGGFEDAADAYRNSAFIDTENGKTCLALASCLRRLKRREEASVWQRKALGLLARMREPKPSIPSTSEYQRHAVGRILKRESLVVDVKAIRRQKQIQNALQTAQNPVAWMIFLIFVALLYVLLGN